MMERNEIYTGMIKDKPKSRSGKCPSFIYSFIHPHLYLITLLSSLCIKYLIILAITLN